MSWRGFIPSTLPVSISYSNMIVDLLGHLRHVKNWNSETLATALKELQMVSLNQSLYLQPSLDRLRVAVLEQNRPVSVEGLLAHHVLKDDSRISVEWQVGSRGVDKRGIQANAS